MLTHPELPSCEDCQRFVFDPARGWEKSERAGKPVPRVNGLPPPCHACPKIPRGERPHPAHAVELAEANYRAYLHYLKCKATGRFPEDAIVEKNAGLLRMVEDQVARQDQQRMIGAVLTAVTAASVRR